MRLTLRTISIAIVLLTITRHWATSSFAAVTISGDSDISAFEIQVGITNFGSLRVDGGSVQTSGILRVGTQQLGAGFVTVTGTGSQLNLNSSTYSEVGQNGLGRLEILNGGLVNISSTSGSLRIGSGSGCCGGPSHGTVIVDGPGSFLTIGNDLSLGTNGTGLLQISNGAIVNAPQSQTQVGDTSRIELNGGMLRLSDLTNNGVVRGSGEIHVGNLSGGGRLEVGAGQLLLIRGGVSLSNSGVITVDGGELEINRNVYNTTAGNDAGEITLRNGTFRIGQSSETLQNSAILAAIGGTNDFYGRVHNGTDGRIAVTNKSLMIFHDDVTADAGTITVFPGASAVFLEDLTMSGSSTLLADLAGSGVDTGFGDIEVVGTATLNSSLVVTLADGFTPNEGDTFPIIAASAISGGLSLAEVADLPAGLKWDLEYESNRVLLSVVPGLAGDYNGDGQVDMADQLIWRKTFGQAGHGLAADGDDNGIVNDGDFTFWQARFGNTLLDGSGASTSTSVPEPSVSLLFYVGFVLIMCGRWKLN